MTVVLAGCGDLGTEVGLRFAAAGREVLGLRRTPEKLPQNITGYGIDLTRERPALPADTDVVIIALTADRRNERGYRETFLGGVSNILDAIGDAGARPRVLFVSSTSVYGNAGGDRVDENTPPTPAGDTASVLVRTERELHDRIPEAIVLRPAGIYGPSRNTLIEQVRSGTAVIRPGPEYTNRIHRDDVAAAIVRLMTAVSHPARIYIGADHEPVDRGHLLRFIADELDVAHPPVDYSATAAPGKRCTNQRLLDTGFRFTYPTFREGYRAVLSGRGTRHA